MLTISLSAGLVGASTGELRGTVIDSLTKSPIEMVSVHISSGVNNFQTYTDEKGEYVIKRMPAGSYDVVFQRTGFHHQPVKNVVISSEQISYLNITLAPTTLKEFVVVPKYYDKPNPIGPHTPCTLVAIGPEEIMTTANERGLMNAITAFVPRTVQTRPDAPINFSGSRGDATLYIVDGVKVIGEPFLPQTGIQEIVVITGGIPAEFGDTTSGVVYVTTKSFR